MFKVMVTGVGGGCGQSIIRALQQSELNLRIYAADVSPISAGHHFPGVIPVVLPKPEENIDAWEDFVWKNQIDAVLPGSDHDLLPLAENRMSYAIVSTPEFVKIANDKSKTVLLAGVRVPETRMGYIDVDDDFEFPVVIKPSFGMTSRGVHIAHNDEELRFYLKRTQNPVVQRYIGGDEYTCGLFFDHNAKYRFGFQMKRWLYAGTTYRAEVTDDPIVEAFMAECGAAFEKYDPFGAVNIQLKVEDGKAYLLEINARASGSTGIRASFGYNEPEMMLRHFCMGETVTRPETRRGVAYRYWDSLTIIDGSFES
jgi:carbamoyl-phosphate synthase large subunit